MTARRRPERPRFIRGAEESHNYGIPRLVATLLARNDTSCQF